MSMMGRMDIGTAMYHNNQKEPFVIISGFNLCDMAGIRTRFGKCGVVTNDRMIGSDMWLQYSRSDETMRALSCNNTAVIPGSWVSVIVSQSPPPLPLEKTKRATPTNDAKRHSADFSFASPEAISLPAASLCPLITPTPSNKEVINYTPSQRPSLSVRWSLLNKLPKETRRDENGYPIPEVCY